MAAKKATSKPTVKRGSDGKMVSLKPAPGPTSGVPTFVGKSKEANAVPARPAKKRKTTRSGKKLTAEGTVAVPTVTREDGKLRGTTPEERKASRTTQLPDVPVVREQEPVLQNIGQVRSKMKGTTTTVSHALMSGLVSQARMHLGRMAETHGTEEMHQHHTAFNEVHATIQAGDHQLGTALGIARHAVMNPTHPDSKAAFNLSSSTISERLGQIKDMEGFSSDADARNRAARADRIAKYKAGKEGTQ
jgi:hypothetical protein